MSTLKCLPLEVFGISGEYINYPLYITELTCPSNWIQPVFNRPGVYVKDNKCWFEIGGGDAFTYRLDYFLYQLAILNASEINARDESALRAISKSKFATKEQLSTLYLIEDAHEIRRCRRMSTIIFNRK